jgi:hypothetical protein
MKRKLLIALALVGGLAAYLSGQGDDDLLASPKSGQTQHKRGRHQTPEGQASVTKGAGLGSKRELIEPWVAQALMDGVQRWQQRGQGTARMDGRQKLVMAWASITPPAQPSPPRPRAQEEAPPPPSLMAPRFPHAWVGRFNDESPAPAQVVGASAPAMVGVARAVLTSPQSTWVVRVGDVIEGQWRIDRIQDRTMSLTYLPLQQQQTVVMR